MSCCYCLGTAHEHHPDLLNEAALTNPGEQLCQKDTGQGKRLREWSRGHQFVVRGGGHIDA